MGDEQTNEEVPSGPETGYNGPEEGQAEESTTQGGGGTESEIKEETQERPQEDKSYKETDAGPGDTTGSIDDGWTGKHDLGENPPPMKTI